jgi:uncharacterized protein YqeY
MYKQAYKHLLSTISGERVTTLQKITLDIKNAMKSGDQIRKNVLRMALSDIKYAQSAINVHQELDEASVMKVLAGYHKKLQKAFEDFPEGDKKKELLVEMAIIEEYLPKKPTPEALERAVDEVMSQNPSRQFGDLMKAVLSHLGSSASAKEVSEIIKRKLT